MESEGRFYAITQPEYRGLGGFRRLWNQSRNELCSLLWEATQSEPLTEAIRPLNPIDPAATPILGAGVTFSSSLRERRLEAMRGGRIEEVTDDGRPTPYDVVYDPANPPEVFFKAILPGHLAKPNQIWIRPDGALDGGMGSSVPEPERVLILDQHGEIVAETIGSDTTARQLESRSPLYLPAAKTYSRCTTLCPWLTVFNPAIDREPVVISMEILRKGKRVYRDEYSSDQMKRTPESLVRNARTMVSGVGFALFTGTGIIPPVEFSLAAGDVVIIDSPQLGRLEAKTQIVRFDF